ncbi:GNAT family N-acetyltransferase [Pseudooceanicola nanhaiensis]|uniref:GNAT family N-acetyltransferase n=1 Tax=Pseudooceanicola nanhaiensis TaxID=375761 RepID=UPI001CD20EE6|nr:GNAT family N-acetyltransferase [Pseudooceanicola nanhaiensis]MCA0920835.1 GNAT family N-acetyltransferase [Pseudooceanicola nanhaiensis]
MTFDPLTLAPQTWRRPDGYEISTDRDRLDRGRVLRYLAEESYWARGMTAEKLDRALAGSLPIGVYAPDGGLAGFARLVTDYAVFAYLRDVFVLPAHERRGLATWLSNVIREHPELATVSNWMLATQDAHGVYERAGFKAVPHPEYYMSVRR